jgi:uncharacterized protein YbgA (DUF1722 family)/uncharacterized protein YbbK (DUF523 family)
MPFKVQEKIRMGVSSCLLGNKVRFDGGHKHNKYITDTLSHFFEFIPVCPEVECGLATPREAMRLVGDPDNPRLVTSKTGVDHTDRMNNWAQTKLVELERENLCGFIFKNRSPSSGMERVKVYDKNKIPKNVGEGLFAGAFKKHFTLLPTEEEGRLNDLLLRENFIESVFVYKRWRDTKEENTADSLVRFHTDHKLLLMAHSEKHLSDLEYLVSGVTSNDIDNVFNQYQKFLMEAMCVKPTVKSHTNVLMHMMGFFEKVLDDEEKKELHGIIENYTNHYVPLIVPATLINHYVRKYKNSQLFNQYYLKPHPTELKLRNHA